MIIFVTAMNSAIQQTCNTINNIYDEFVSIVEHLGRNDLINSIYNSILHWISS